MTIKLNKIYPSAFVYKIHYKDMKPYIGICGRPVALHKRFSEHKSHNGSNVTRLHQQSKILFDEALKNDELPTIEYLEQCENILGSELLRKEALYSIEYSSINSYSSKHF